MITIYRLNIHVCMLKIYIVKYVLIVHNNVIFLQYMMLSYLLVFDFLKPLFRRPGIGCSIFQRLCRSLFSLHAVPRLQGGAAWSRSDDREGLNRYRRSIPVAIGNVSRAVFMVFGWVLSRIYQQTLNGSFSAVSTPMFANKC